MLPPGTQKQRYVERMFDDIAPRYDFMNRLMTFGIDRSWRRATIEAAGIGPGSVVADIGCGSGDLCVDAASSGATMIGIDPSRGMLELAQRRAPRAQLLRTVGEALPLADSSCTAVVSGFALRNWSSIPSVFSEAARVLVSGGRLAVLEIDVPDRASLRLGFNLYFGRVVPWLGSVLSNANAYQYLADSLAYLPSNVELHGMLADAGFEDMLKTRLTGGVAQLITATRSTGRPNV
jgi:demethylmenaquinone methyltransferase/2-methoxy-6-polyprenyl-1,4-benzoquinol methylase